MKHVRVALALFSFFVLPGLLLFAEPSAETATTDSTTAIEKTDYFPQKVTVDYSTLFTVEYHPNYKIVTISRPWPGADTGLRYLLVQRGTEAPSIDNIDAIIEIPVQSIVTLSTSYLPHLDMLGVLDALIGMDSFNWVSSPAVLEKIAEGGMKEVGSGPSVNVELLVEMEPELIMTFGQGSEWDTHPKLKEAKLPYVINADWNEATPLARAEWIKFMALFFNKEARANELFNTIETEYKRLSTIAASASNKPTVFSGAPYQGTWWVAGGGSYAAKLFADAGADYIWADDDSTGSLMLDIETVYDKAGHADFWLNTGYWNTLADAKAADERFPEFEAFKSGALYNNNLRMGPGGGNEYYETGPANPHVILADLIRIFHPELLPDHTLFYYRKLN